MRLAFLAVFSVVAALAGACDGDGAAQPPPTGPTASVSATATAGGSTVVPATAESGLEIIEIRLESGGVLRAEVPRTRDEFFLGLGERDSLPPDGGMLFDAGYVRVPRFSMRGMRFPLDFVWVGEDKRVVSVTPDAQPEAGVPVGQLRVYSPGVPVRYVLELNAGTAARLGIQPGDVLEFETPS
jgi:uncharacterized membrane protein (UPF0127 family)